MSARRSVRIPFNDLRRRTRSIQTELRSAFDGTLESGGFILGKAVARFESSFAGYCGSAHCVGVASGTDAIWLSLEALGIGAGAEVVTAANTCAATISGVLKSGAVPVLADVDARTLTIDPASVEACITPRTRAILPVHLYGQCADMDALSALARERGLKIVEDCAQAHGAEYRGRRAGSIGDAGCFSFYPTKNLGAIGDGGAVTTNDAATAQRLRLLRNHGCSRAYDCVSAGFNSRLDELQAALLLAALDRLDGWNERRRRLASVYHSGLSKTGVQPPYAAAGRAHIYHLYVVQVPERDRFRAALAAAGVETMIHYPIPIHRMPGYGERCRVGPRGLPVTEEAAQMVLSLPMYPELTDEEARAVLSATATVKAC